MTADDGPISTGRRDDPAVTPFDLARKLKNLELLHRIGLSLSAERNRERLVETILLEAKALCRADGGTLYVRGDDDCLHFAMVHNETLGLALGGTTGRPIPFQPIPLFSPVDGAPNHANVASHAVHHRGAVVLDDAYENEVYDFSGTRAFDAAHGYRSRSFLTVPLIDSEARVIAVLQLINARAAVAVGSGTEAEARPGAIVAFESEDLEMVRALASHAAIALENQQLLDGQKQLLESFIRLIAASIDAKSAYTGGHCERVPVLTEMLAKAACEASGGVFEGFDLSPEEWYELRIAAWLHDCGKITTPVHVMDKATKLETICDRLEAVRDRFEIAKRDEVLAAVASGVEVGEARSLLGGGEDFVASQARHLEPWAQRIAEIDDAFAFVERINRGGETLCPEDLQRIDVIARRHYRRGRAEVPLLRDDEVAALRVARGTLTAAERLEINAHMVQTLTMLEQLPFPRGLRRVPEYAGGHHERMDGRGYPRGIFAGDLSIPARIMAVADVFEALTAQDRPYKPGKPLSESMALMGAMKRDNHLDPEVFDLFVRSGVYRAYAERFLPAELIDEVDEASLLAIVPRPFEVPSAAVRAERWRGFLAEYRRYVPKTRAAWGAR